MLSGGRSDVFDNPALFAPFAALKLTNAYAGELLLISVSGRSRGAILVWEYGLVAHKTGVNEMK